MVVVGGCEVGWVVGWVRVCGCGWGKGGVVRVWGSSRFEAHRDDQHACHDGGHQADSCTWSLHCPLVFPCSPAAPSSCPPPPPPPPAAPAAARLRDATTAASLPATRFTSRISIPSVDAILACARGMTSCGSCLYFLCVRPGTDCWEGRGRGGGRGGWSPQSTVSTRG